MKKYVVKNEDGQYWVGDYGASANWTDELSGAIQYMNIHALVNSIGLLTGESIHVVDVPED